MPYALDLTASLKANYVTSVIDRPASGVWLFKLPGGAFFTKDLKVEQPFSGVELEPMLQYRALDYNPDASDMAVKEVCNLLLITDPALSQVRVSYRVIGGQFQTIGTDVDKLVKEAKLDAVNTTQWGQVVGVPDQLPPEMHRHYDSDIYGMEPAFFLLEKIAQAVSRGDNGVYGQMYQYIDRMLAILKTETDKKIEALTKAADGVKDRGKMKVNQIVIFSDNSDPAKVFNYGRWERLPEGLFIATGKDAEVGKRRKLGEGPDYIGQYYAAWRYLGG